MRPEPKNLAISPPLGLVLRRDLRVEIALSCEGLAGVRLVGSWGRGGRGGVVARAPSRVYEVPTRPPMTCRPHPAVYSLFPRGISSEIELATLLNHMQGSHHSLTTQREYFCTRIALRPVLPSLRFSVLCTWRATERLSVPFFLADADKAVQKMTVLFCFGGTEK